MSPTAVIFDFNRTIFNPETGRLMSGALDLIRSLHEKGVTLFLIAKGDDSRKKQIDDLGLRPFFKTITINQSKSPEDYRACLTQCEPGNKFYAIGDRVQEEIRHANACGMTTIWFRNGKFSSEEPQCEEENPAFTINSLSEAIAIILQ